MAETKTLSELEAEVIESNAALVEAQRAESIAEQVRCNALNRANRAQAALDAALLSMKRAAPRNTNWSRQVPMPDLAAIIEEGESAELAYRNAKPFTSSEIGAGNWCHAFYVEHGPRLLAVCGAALRVQSDLDDCSTAPLTIEAVEALRAAVRGDAGGE